MKCLVTGVETNNKWRGHPLCREVVEMSKAMENEVGFQGKNMRQRLIKLQDQWNERVAKEAGKAKE